MCPTYAVERGCLEEPLASNGGLELSALRHFADRIETSERRLGVDFGRSEVAAPGWVLSATAADRDLGVSFQKAAAGNAVT
jgi:hypothetical protein